MTRFLYMHGNGTLRWAHSFAPRLKSQLEELGYETFFETMPDSIAARKQYWMQFLEEEMQATPQDVLAYEVPNGAHFESIEEVPGLIDAIKENFR